jgi:hypothetical protein
MIYRNDFKDISKEYYWTVPKIVIGLLFAGFCIMIAGLLVLPTKLVSSVLNPNAIITNYEFFHDANNKIKAKVGQINSHKTIVQSNTDASENVRLRIELSAMQQSCRELAGQYNSNATKVNRGIFMGREAPSTIPQTVCE